MPRWFELSTISLIALGNSLSTPMRRQKHLVTPVVVALAEEFRELTAGTVNSVPNARRIRSPKGPNFPKARKSA